MGLIFSILSWAFALLISICSILIIDDSKIIALCWFAMSMLLFPPIRELVYSKTEKEINFATRCVLLMILFIASLFVADDLDQKEKAQLAIEEKRKDYLMRRQMVIVSVEEALERGDYEKALIESALYMDVADGHLKKLNKMAHEALAKRINKTKYQPSN